MNAKTIALAITAVATVGLLPNCASNDPVTRVNASNARASEIAQESRAALNSLYSKDPNARALGRRAKGVLVFPNVVKGGLIVGAQAGNGAMIRNGAISGYYQTVSASYGLQAGVQKFGYALFLMDNAALRNLDQTDGWEIGTNPNVVVLDRGKATALTTTTANKGTYAYFFDQQGLMAGLALQGTKITRIYPQQ
jgi:lipid-binding SYLF domain-containing protein